MITTLLFGVLGIIAIFIAHVFINFCLFYYIEGKVNRDSLLFGPGVTILFYLGVGIFCLWGIGALAEIVFYNIP